MTLATDDRPPPIVTPYRWTIDRYHKAVEAGIFDGQPLELLDGELIEMSPEGIPHAGVSSDGADYLRETLGSQVKVREAKPITLPNDNAVFDRDTYALGMLSPTMRLQLALLIKLTALCQKS